MQELINKVKNDTNMANSSKMDTLAILVMRFVEENSEYDFYIQLFYLLLILYDRLQNEATMVKDQMKKHKEAKDAIKALNEFLKKQIGLVKQESALRLEVIRERVGKTWFDLMIFLRRNNPKENNPWEDTRQL